MAPRCPFQLLMGPLVAAMLMAMAPALPRQTIDPDKVYRRDISLTVNGQKGVGVMVAKATKRYLIQGETRHQIDLLTITTCHRDYKAENLKKVFEYIFEPVDGVETSGGCPMQISAYDMNGVHSWALIDFEDAGATVPAKMKCNGEVKTFSGASICQSREGLTQEIEFETPMKVAPEKDCPMPIPEDHKTFVFPIAPRECVYAFMDEKGALHRMTTIGFQGTLLRNE